MAEVVPTGEENVCAICLEGWTRSGRHRICSLPCGHVFGFCCVEEWVSRRKVCPTCKGAVRSKGQIRLLFGTAAKLTVLDRGRVDVLEEALEKERKMKQEAQREAAEWRLRYRALRDEMDRREVEQQQLDEQRVRTAKRARPGSCGGVIDYGGVIGQCGPVLLEGTVIGAENVVTDLEVVSTDRGVSVEVISEDPFRIAPQEAPKWKTKFVVSSVGCNSVDIDRNGWYVFGSRKHLPSGQFEVFRCSSLSDTVCDGIVTLPYKGQIQDIRCHPEGDRKMLLLASQDGSLSIHKTDYLSLALTYRISGPALSCSWITGCENLVACGSGNAKVFLFDIRVFDRELFSFQGDSRGGPVHTVLWDQKKSLLAGVTPKSIFTRRLDLSGNNASMTTEPVRSFSLASQCQAAWMSDATAGGVWLSLRELPGLGSALQLHRDLESLDEASCSPLTGHVSSAHRSRSSSARMKDHHLVMAASVDPTGIFCWRLDWSLDSRRVWTTTEFPSGHSARVTDIRCHPESGTAATVSENRIEVLQYG
uniref:RING-type domain-containing protein n=1 Tax=Compsopogon caeruleus TaxID=31354 RepID=A0A7S1T5Y3_9RHOD